MATALAAELTRHLKRDLVASGDEPRHSKHEQQRALAPCVRHLLLSPHGRISSRQLFSDAVSAGRARLPVYVISYERSTVVSHAEENLRVAGVTSAEVITIRNESSCDSACRSEWLGCLLDQEFYLKGIGRAAGEQDMYDSYGTRTTITHLGALARIVDRGERYAFIVEDDVKLSAIGQQLSASTPGGLAAVVTPLAQALHANERQLGILNFGGCFDLHAGPTWPLMAELPFAHGNETTALRAYRHPEASGARRKAGSPSRHRCSNGYVISWRLAHLWLTRAQRQHHVTFDRNMGELFAAVQDVWPNTTSFHQDWVEPPLVCQWMSKYTKYRTRVQRC